MGVRRETKGKDSYFRKDCAIRERKSLVVTTIRDGPYPCPRRGTDRGSGENVHGIGRAPGRNRVVPPDLNAGAGGAGAGAADGEAAHVRAGTGARGATETQAGDGGGKQRRRRRGQ